MEQKSQKLILGTVGVAGLFLAGGATVSANTTHKVAENDTVWGLSQKYGVSVKSIEELNHVDSNSHLIFTGHTIDIPDKATKSVAKPATKAAPKEKTQTATSTYEVKAGDSLWSIAQAHNTTVDRLRSLNSLGSGVIVPGQALKVDGPATKAAQPNEAAQSAAKKAQAPKQQEASTTTTKEAQKATPVTPAKGSTPSVQPQQDKNSNKDVQPQQTKQVVEQPQAPQESSAKKSAAPVKETEKPAVQTEKDNEQNVSQPKDEPVQKEDVQKDEQSKQKEAAQPKVSANHKTHSVKSGESLFTIAADYGVSVDSIRQANTLSSSALQVGQSLTVNDPTKDPSATATAKPAQASPNSTAKQNVQPAAQKQPSTPAPSQTSNNSSNNNASQNSASSTTTNTSNTTQKPQQEANNENNSGKNNAAQTTPAASNTNATHGHATNTAGNTYDWGQCTWFAKDRASWAGNYWGNGGQWDASARAQGFSVDNQPSAGSLVVFHPGQSVGGQWTADGSAGHVAYVESVSGSSITISQGGMGFSNPSGPNYQTISNASQYTYIHP
ncbi:LysM peptidoglycan-binding domain-containing protein [Ligilactobacillus pobuzihii]|uniref:Surface antigen n=1 Tax=Ligilactobacillus pobuzihii TaxID=449659 RepID=A0A0R2LK21_9LACO|nr:LysM peptidoglycan-binding domain-containing protein [Ligilactobacillus pobuzihii]KRK08965.1 Surface antigen [Ligilactobacillus pobuzihii E100301 = KCTC 13174]KRO02024.1 Surface antigen [Ligilactobacillus pobuzihii]GEN49320.1 hypothetical protein LPO01_21120 [Ligilactobacillus pobuzihii]